MALVADERAVEIAQANDEFRRAGWGVTMTVGVQYLPDVNGLMKKVRDYDLFYEGNDPYGQHDFGRIDWYGKTVFWKINYTTKH